MSDKKNLKLIDGNAQPDLWENIFEQFGTLIPKTLGTDEGMTARIPAFTAPMYFDRQVVELLDRTDGYYKNKGEIVRTCALIGMKMLYPKWVGQDGRLVRDGILDICRDSHVYEDRKRYLAMAREQRSKAMRAWSEGLCSSEELNRIIKNIKAGCPDDATRALVDKMCEGDIDG